jgi:hypothetical protein
MLEYDKLGGECGYYDISVYRDPIKSELTHQ